MSKKDFFQQGQSSTLMTVFFFIIEDCVLITDTVRIRLQEKGPYSTITHIDYLKELFPDEDFPMF